MGQTVTEEIEEDDDAPDAEDNVPGAGATAGDTGARTVAPGRTSFRS